MSGHRNGKHKKHKGRKNKMTTKKQQQRRPGRLNKTIVDMRCVECGHGFTTHWKTQLIVCKECRVIDSVLGRYEC